MGPEKATKVISLVSMETTASVSNYIILMKFDAFTIYFQCRLIDQLGAHAHEDLLGQTSMMVRNNHFNYSFHCLTIHTIIIVLVYFFNTG